MDNNQALSQVHCSYLQEMQQEPVAETWDGGAYLRKRGVFRYRR